MGTLRLKYLLYGYMEPLGYPDSCSVEAEVLGSCLGFGAGSLGHHVPT